jgi:choline dehydrogenase
MDIPARRRRLTAQRLAAREPRGEDLLNPSPARSTFDYLVVGGGTAGCVVAARLSADPAVTVCLLEAGGRARHPAMSVPLMNFITSGLPQHQWGYLTDPDRGLAGRSLRFVQARVLGGGSAINGMLYSRGDRDDFEAWACPDWRYQAVRPYFERAEARPGGIEISRGAALTPACELFLAATAAAGHRRLHDMNGEEAEGFGYFDYSIGRGRRSGTMDGYLRQAEERPNLTVMTGTQALKVRLEGGRAVGVQALRGGVVVELAARSEVVVCAGAINSPRLLMLSGLGPAEDLRALGIAVALDRPEVGGNLQNHTRQKLGFTTRRPITAYGLLAPTALVEAVAAYALRRRGALGRSVLTAGGLLRSSPQAEGPDIGVIFTPGLMTPGSGLGMLPRAHGFSLFVRNARPWSRGKVRLRSADPLEAPRIATGYFQDPRDMTALLGGLARVKAILAQSAMAEVIDRAQDPEPTAQSIARSASHAYHPVGTLRMGLDDDAVVDEQLRVRGVEGLRIADASVIPVIPKAGTNAPTIMIGERAAALIRGEAGA